MNWRLPTGAAVALVLVALVVALFLVPVPAVQGAIVGGLIGLISSQVALFVQRRLREHGKVICQVSAWTNAFVWTDAATTGYEEAVNLEDFEHTKFVEVGVPVPVEGRCFRVRFHNQKDVSIALWDIKAEFSKEGKETISLEPRRSREDQEDLEPLNLTSREATYIDMELEAKGDDIQRVKEADKAELVMSVAGGGELRKALPHWMDLQDD